VTDTESVGTADLLTQTRPAIQLGLSGTQTVNNVGQFLGLTLMTVLAGEIARPPVGNWERGPRSVGSATLTRRDLPGEKTDGPRPSKLSRRTVRRVARHRLSLSPTAHADLPSRNGEYAITFIVGPKSGTSMATGDPTGQYTDT
jgi:hypothetical protein